MKNYIIIAFISVISLVAGVLIDRYEVASKHKQAISFLESRGCVNLGDSKDAEVSKYLGPGFACGNTLVILVK